MNLPNIISMLRVVAVPLLVWLVLEGLIMAAFWLFLIAGISDAVDGAIAKRFNMETELGKFLDPLADKMLLVSAFVIMGWVGLIPTWLAILVVFRDVAIIAGALLVETMTNSLVMRPILISKVNTAMQIVYAALVLGGAGYAPQLGGMLDGVLRVAMALTAGTTVASWVAYGLICIRLLDEQNGNQKGTEDG